jgi:TRAP-type transport system small permease protein
MSCVKRFLDLVTTLTAGLLAIVIGTMAIIVLGGVFWRYALSDSQAWIEELARYLMVWGAFLGAPLAVRSGGHVALSFLNDLLPPPAALGVRLLAKIIFATFLAFVAWQGVYLISDTIDQLSPVLGVPMGYVYAAVPIGCALMLLQLLYLIPEEFLQYARPPMAEPAQH